MSVLTDFTLRSWKDFDIGLLLIGSKEMIWITSFTSETMQYFSFIDINIIFIDFLHIIYMCYSLIFQYSTMTGRRMQYSCRSVHLLLWPSHMSNVFIRTNEPNHTSRSCTIRNIIFTISMPPYICFISCLVHTHTYSSACFQRIFTPRRLSERDTMWVSSVRLETCRSCTQRTPTRMSALTLQCTHVPVDSSPMPSTVAMSSDYLPFTKLQENWLTKETTISFRTWT